MSSLHKPILHQYQVSPFAAKVRRCLYYKGIPFDTVNYGLSGVGKIKKLNPRGKAPFMVHNGLIIADSTDIIGYLEKTYPEKRLIPADARLSAQASIIEDWADESLYFFDLTMRSWPNNSALLAEDLLLEDKGIMRRVFQPLIPRIIARQAHGQGTGRKDRESVCKEIEEHFRSIDTLVKDTGWLVGDHLSVADIAVASMCTVLDRAEEAQALMAEAPALLDWRERVDILTLPQGTPAAQRALV